MLDDLLRFVSERSAGRLARDALDVFIVYYLCYRALLVLRGTRAMQVGIGLAAVFVLYLVADQLQLVSVVSVLGALISSIILVIVVVFQNDIRRGLMRVGSTLPGLTRSRESAVIDEVVDAATELARHRMGAIIAFEQDANLDEFVGANKGRLVDAAVSRELLVSLFIPEAMNKLHDGAVIIRNLRIAKAGVFFPMAQGRVLDQSFGSRHRAAIGITEETDAVVVVVSEERGTISYCFNGNIAPNLDGPRLRTLLERVFHPKPRQKKRKAAPAVTTPAPTSARAEIETPLPVAVGEETTLSLRGEAEPTSRVGRDTRVPESEHRSASQPPPPLRPRPTPESGAGATSKPAATAPDSDPRPSSRTPAPLRARPKGETDAPASGDTGPQTPVGATAESLTEPPRVPLPTRSMPTQSGTGGGGSGPDSNDRRSGGS
jgi:diadenylate cyclase